MHDLMLFFLHASGPEVIILESNKPLLGYQPKNKPEFDPKGVLPFCSPWPDLFE